MIEELTTKFPLTDERITGEQNQKEFIVLFGAILRMRNLLSSFDDFAGHEIISERDLQDYLGRYQDLRDEWKNRRPSQTFAQTIVMITHNEEIAQMADRIIRIEDGRIVTRG